MFTKLLIPLDGSLLAERALPYAEALAEVSGARLLLVRAAVARAFPGGSSIQLQAEAIADAEAYLDGVARRLRGRGREVETAVPYGEAAQAVLDELSVRRADVVVMVTHGRSGLGRWVYGSVAEAILARSPVPVMLVRAWEDGAVPALAEGARVLVPLDGSAFSQAALPLAQALARVLRGSLVLVHVASAPDRVLAVDGRVVTYLTHGTFATQLEQEVDERLTKARTWLQRQTAVLRTPELRVEIDVRIGELQEGIAAASKEHGAALVVMSTHGRSGIGRLLLGSAAAGVLRRGQTPILLVRPAAVGPSSAALLPEPEEGLGEAPLNLSLTEDEVVLVRTALYTLGQVAPRPGHIQERIHRMLARLSAPTNGAVAPPEEAASSPAGEGRSTAT